MRNPLAAYFEGFKPSNSGTQSKSLQLVRARAVKFNARVGAVLALVGVPVAIVYAAMGMTLAGGMLAILSVAFAMPMLFAHQNRIQAAIVAQTAMLCMVGIAAALLQHSSPFASTSVVILAAIIAYLIGDRGTQLASNVLVAASVVLQTLIFAGGIDFPLIETFLSSSILATALLSVGFVMLATTLVELRRAFFAHEKDRMRTFSHLVESVRDAVAKYSADGELVYLSHTSEKLFGCKRYELAGGGLVDRIHILDRPRYLSALDGVAHKHDSRSIDIRVRCDREDGSHFVWVEVALSAVLEGDVSERAEVIAIVRDITMRKEQERDIAEARKAAEKASEAKSRFLATIGHELRTPLNAVVGFSDMMLANIGGELSEDHTEYAGLIKQSGMHLLDTVSMLLDMSKIEAGKFEIQPEEVSAEEFVKPCFSIVKNAADKKKVSLVSELPKHLPKLMADERACRQILINLLSNAVKFSDEGSEVKLKVRLSGTAIELCVIDSGIGISPEDVERLGEPFFQAQNSLSRKYEGTGLGLSIVRGLTELHDGKVKIKSTLGEGTAISIVLPIDGPQPEAEHRVLEELSDRQFVEEERRQHLFSKAKAG